MKRIIVLLGVLLMYIGAAYSQTVPSEGQLAYSIPIVVPPAVKGMAPSISIDHNSAAKQGIAGYGWSITGLTSITRDTTYDLTYNDATDHFKSSDGKLIVLADG
jgi:hypothetical protein